MILTADPPADLSQYKSFPDSYKKCAAVHETLAFPEAGWSLYFGHPMLEYMNRALQLNHDPHKETEAFIKSHPKCEVD